MEIIPKKKKHNGVVRTIHGNVVNEEICEKIKTHIDEMERYMSSKQVKSSLQQQLIGQRSLPKTEFEHEMNSTKEIMKKNTHYGNLSICSTISSNSKTNPIVQEAIEKMGLDMDDICRNTKNKRKIAIDTSGLKKKVHNATTNTLTKISESSPSWCDPSEWIAYRLEIIKNLMPDIIKYNYHYNRAKNIFEHGTENGTFPTSFVYKDVVLYWEKTTTKQSLHDSVYEFIKENHTNRLCEFAACLMAARYAQNKYTLVYLLDDVDYILGTSF